MHSDVRYMSKVLTNLENCILPTSGEGIMTSTAAGPASGSVSATEHESVWSDLQGVAFSQGYLDVGGVRTR